MNNNGMLKKTAIVLAALLAASAGYFYVQKQHLAQKCNVQETGPIYEYNEQRDKEDILKFFITERYWLLSSDDYDPEFMLEFRAPSKDPLYLGRLQVKVLREGDKLVGFTTYYKETPTVGTVLFLAINKEFRGKGYGQKLIEFAINDLACMGSTTVTLVTRTDNFKAQRLYERLGFKNVYVHKEAEQIHYEKQLK